MPDLSVSPSMVKRVVFVLEAYHESNHSQPKRNEEKRCSNIKSASLEWTTDNLVFVCLFNHCFLQVQCFLLPLCKIEHHCQSCRCLPPTKFHVGAVKAGRNSGQISHGHLGTEISAMWATCFQPSHWWGVWHLPVDGYLMSIGTPWAP